MSIIVEESTCHNCIFPADYGDRRGATVESDDPHLHYRVHATYEDGVRAVVVANHGREEATYEYAVPDAGDLRLVTPTGDDRTVPESGAESLTCEGVHVLLEED